MNSREVSVRKRVRMTERTECEKFVFILDPRKLRMRSERPERSFMCVLELSRM